MQMPKPLHRGTQAALVALVLAPVAIGQEPGVKVTSKQTQTNIGESKKSNPDGLVQELDADSLALSKLPTAPLFRPDPLAPIFEPLNRLVDRAQRSEHLKVGATYTLLEEYATTVPKEASRHDQVSGRLDLTAVWKAYERNSSAGSISLLVRSGTNIGMSQQFNLSDKLGSGLYLNALQGGGPQEPITGGAALEVQATPHLYVHTLAVDTEGSQQSNLKTLVNRKYMESGEVGWFSGSPGERYRDYRIYMWRDDTRSQGSGYGGGFGFEHEFDSGWAPFGKFGIATEHGTSIRQTNTLGVAQVHPFARRGDMFGVSFSYTEPNHTGKHHENVFESFYRIRLTQSVSLGPDLAVSVHPTYAIKTYTTALVGTRLEITF